MTLPLGSRIAEFEVVEVLGEGGFGVVYLALDRQLGRPVALKEYMPGSLAQRKPDLSIMPRGPQFEEAFELGKHSFVNEARLLAQFDHPALAKIHRFWEDHGTAYIVMPFYEGRTLKACLQEQPHPPESWLRALLGPLLDALDTLHARHCYHRDIAPDNILLLDDGKPLLLDFGAARQVIGEATHALTVILKSGYAPIEQYSDVPGLKQGPWTDIYALAAVLYTAIAGKPPEPAVGRVVVDNHPSALIIGASRYSQEFLSAIDAGLALMPKDRPQAVAEFAALLSRAREPDDRTVMRQIPVLAGPTPSPGHAAASQTLPRLVPSAPSAHASPAAAPLSMVATDMPHRHGPTSRQREQSGHRRVLRWGGSALAALIVGGVATWWGVLRTPQPLHPQPAATGPAAMSETVATAPPLAAAWHPFDVSEVVTKGASGSLRLDLSVPQRGVRVGEPVAFTVKVRSTGYLYVLSIPERTRDVVLLFPNAKDESNRVQAGETIQLPRAGWQLEAGDPPERLSLLGILSPTPRTFEAPRFTHQEPFATADLSGARSEDVRGVAEWLIGKPRDCTGTRCAEYGAAATVLETHPGGL